MKNNLALLIIIFLLLILNLELVALLKIKKSQPAFVDVLEISGIRDYPHSAGASWADYDNDGYLDLLVTGNAVKLYRNTGDGTFVDVTHEAKLDLLSPNMFYARAGIFGDYDNDGCLDLYIVASGPRHSDILYHNNCDATFSDVTQAAGLQQEKYYGGGASWADYDKDGYLDLYVANYGVNPPVVKEYRFEPNILYHNNGDGTFTDVTNEAKVRGDTNCGPISKHHLEFARKGQPIKESFQPIWFDFDNDGNSDLFVATDGGVSPLYRNNGDGTFTEVTKEAGLCRMGTGMGVTAGDYDNDGDLDLYVTNIGANYFWRNNNDNTFSEIAAETDTADHVSIGWGTGFFDYDNDGYLDLYIVNGTAYGKEDDPEVGRIKIDKLYKNNANGTFSNVSLQEGIDGDYVKESAAFGDYNNDGFVDLFVVSRYQLNEGNYRLYQNQGNQNHWLTIQLTGTKSNRDAVGARITLKAGGKKQIRELMSGSSFTSQDSLWQTFGLGKATVVDEVEIKWPSGVKTLLNNVKINQKIVVLEEK